MITEFMHYFSGDMNMRFLNTLFITFALTAISNLATAAEPLRVLDNGLDGNTRYYTITCPDGSRSTVNVKFDIPDEPTESTEGPRIVEVCIFSSAGQKCQPKWDLDAAAKTSCSKF